MLFRSNQQSFPSWLYPVKKGATTIWERWDGIKPDGSFQDAGMNSFNHYAYGAIGEWLYRVVAGLEIDPAAPGYKHILFQPQPGGGLTAAQATLDSPYGLVTTAWTLGATDFRLRITVPPNTHATVRLPAQQLEQVSEGDQPIGIGDGILSAQVEGDVAVIEVGAGAYEFVTSGLTLAQAMVGVHHVAGRLDRYSTLRDLLASDAAQTVLAHHLGAEFLQAPQLGMVMDAPLVTVADFAPGLLTVEKFAAIERDLS